MSHAADLPPGVAVVVAFFVVLGAGLTLVGSFGFYRLRSFYDRIHAPTLGTSWGTAAIVMASMILFSALQSRLVVHEILIGIFVTVTTPVTLMLLGRAALYRDRAERNPDVPAMDPPKGSLVASREDDGEPAAAVAQPDVSGP
ncbi:MAG: cation:proton antiporter [Hyphomicrobiales bacterium]|nr:MAG: cation:proton antiporter [Hyphomicrobiales bacterium]